MLERVTPTRLETAKSEISELLNAHVEWFFTLTEGTAQTGKTEALGRSELDITIAHGRLLLTCWTEQGTRAWKIFAREWTGEKLLLQASRKMGAERPLIELVPRASASAIALTVKTSRQKRCDQLAQLACSLQTGARVERAALSRAHDAVSPDVTRELFCGRSINASLLQVALRRARRVMQTHFFRRLCCGSPVPVNVCVLPTSKDSGSSLRVLC